MIGTEGLQVPKCDAAYPVTVHNLQVPLALLSGQRWRHRQPRDHCNNAYEQSMVSKPHLSPPFLRVSVPPDIGPDSPGELLLRCLSQSPLATTIIHAPSRVLAVSRCSP